MSLHPALQEFKDICHRHGFWEARQGPERLGHQASPEEFAAFLEEVLPCLQRWRHTDQTPDVAGLAPEDILGRALDATPSLTPEVIEAIGTYGYLLAVASDHQDCGPPLADSLQQQAHRVFQSALLAAQQSDPEERDEGQKTWWARDAQNAGIGLSAFLKEHSSISLIPRFAQQLVNWHDQLSSPLQDSSERKLVEAMGSVLLADVSLDPEILEEWWQVLPDQKQRERIAYQVARHPAASRTLLEVLWEEYGPKIGVAMSAQEGVQEDREFRLRIARNCPHYRVLLNLLPAAQGEELDVLMKHLAGELSPPHQEAALRVVSEQQLQSLSSDRLSQLLGQLPPRIRRQLFQRLGRDPTTTAPSSPRRP